jgi:hypothetical protein
MADQRGTDADRYMMAIAHLVVGEIGSADQDR